MLVIKDLHVYYGGIHALKGISLKVDRGKIVSLIGANGAGKSTCLNAVSSLVKAKSGQVTFLDKEITKTAPHRVVKYGVVQVPEGRKVFPQMTVSENLDMGAFIRNNSKEIRQSKKKIYDIFPRLLERERQLAGTLSGGEQQMLAIGRALMANPSILLLDEPSMGLAPILVKEIFTIIKEINELGTTILLVEQNANMALSISSYAYVLETGRIVLEGSAQELIQDENVKKAYLGG